MASVFHLCCDAFDIKQRIVNTYSDFQAIDKKLYFSAVAIQKTWHGYVIRKQMKDWHKKATLIQKYVRGWLVRLHLPGVLHSNYYDLSVEYYNKQAIKIQAFYRGYSIRKETLSIKTLLQERLEREGVTAAMAEKMTKAFEDLRSGSWSETYQYLEKILKMLFERHHLLRTTTLEGVFSVHGSYELSRVEKILKSFPLKAYMKELRALLHKENLHISTTLQEKQERFDLNTHIKEKPYERMMLTQD